MTHQGRLVLILGLAVALLSWVATAHADPVITISGLPAEGVTVTGSVTVTVEVGGADGSDVTAYWDLELGSHVDSAPDPWVDTFTIDTSKFYDGDHLLNVHVHGTDGIAFSHAKHRVVTENANPAPNGDRLLPSIEVLIWEWDSDETSALVVHAWSRVSDDKPAVGIQTLCHIGDHMLYPATTRPRTSMDNPTTSLDFHAIYRTYLLPFQTDVARTIPVCLCLTDGVGRANIIVQNISIPARSEGERGLSLPGAEILNVEEFQDFLPDVVHVRLTNADLDTSITLWLGDEKIHTKNLTGSETEVWLPVNQDVTDKFFSPTIGAAARATALWVTFQPDLSHFPRLNAAVQAGQTSSKVRISNGAHVHLNPIADGAPRANLKVRGYLKDNDYTWFSPSKVRPSLDGWMRVTMTIRPDKGLEFPAKEIGIQVSDNAALWAGSFWIDRFMVNDTVLYDFEDGAVYPFEIKGTNIASLAVDTARAYDGAAAMKVTLNADDSQGYIRWKLPTGIEIGDVITFWIYCPTP